MAKCSSLSRKIKDRIRERGPITVAAFMDLALYDPDAGYYARAARRTGRAGDFFTSVDVGPLFGDVLAAQIVEMASDAFFSPDGNGPRPRFDLVEAGAANGQLAADILDGIARRDPDLYSRLRLHLVERSGEARRAQAAVLGRHSARVAASGEALPPSYAGVLVANELLDALPAHQVVMRADGLREVYVTADDDRLTTCEGRPSTPEIEEYFRRVDAPLEPGWRAEVNLAAIRWVRDAARRLRRGFLILIDYGHDARELYSAGHSSGTLTTFSSHHARGPEAAGEPPWLAEPGEQDITAHVDFTSVRAAAESEGVDLVGFMDQTYFVLGILSGPDASLADLPADQRRMLKTLITPGGLGSTMKVLVMSRGFERRTLAGCSWGQRVT